jgi:hypothetical protein
MFPFLNKDKPVKITFYFDKSQKRMTWDDLNTVEMMQEGNVSATRLMSFAARFMANEKNQYLPYEKAVKILGSLNEADIADVIRQFTEALQGTAVPNASGKPSPSPSDPGPATASPDGSEL